MARHGLTMRHYAIAIASLALGIDWHWVRVGVGMAGALGLAWGALGLAWGALGLAWGALGLAWGARWGWHGRGIAGEAGGIYGDLFNNDPPTRLAPTDLQIPHPPSPYRSTDPPPA